MTDFEAIIYSREHWETILFFLKRAAYIGKSNGSNIIFFDNKKNIILKCSYCSSGCACCKESKKDVQRQIKLGKKILIKCIDTCPAAKVLKTTCFENGWTFFRNLILRISPLSTLQSRSKIVRIDNSLIFASELILNWLKDAELKLLSQKGI